MAKLGLFFCHGREHEHPNLSPFIPKIGIEWLTADDEPSVNPIFKADYNDLNTLGQFDDYMFDYVYPIKCPLYQNLNELKNLISYSNYLLRKDGYLIIDNVFQIMYLMYLSYYGYVTNSNVGAFDMITLFKHTMANIIQNYNYSSYFIVDTNGYLVNEKWIFQNLQHRINQIDKSKDPRYEYNYFADDNLSLILKKATNPLITGVFCHGYEHRNPTIPTMIDQTQSRLILIDTDEETEPDIVASVFNEPEIIGLNKYDIIIPQFCPSLNMLIRFESLLEVCSKCLKFDGSLVQHGLFDIVMKACCINNDLPGSQSESMNIYMRFHRYIESVKEKFGYRYHYLLKYNGSELSLNEIIFGIDNVLNESMYTNGNNYYLILTK